MVNTSQNVKCYSTFPVLMFNGERVFELAHYQEVLCTLSNNLIKSLSITRKRAAEVKAKKISRPVIEIPAPPRMKFLASDGMVLKSMPPQEE